MRNWIWVQNFLTKCWKNKPRRFSTMWKRGIKKKLYILLIKAKYFIDKMKFTKLVSMKLNLNQSVTINLNQSVSLDSVGASGGFLVMWKDWKVKVVEVVTDRSSVSVLFELDNGSELWVSGVYSRASYKSRCNFWSRLYDIQGLRRDHWCIGWDFNVVRKIKKLTRGRITKSMKAFNLSWESRSLFEVVLSIVGYAWSNNHEALFSPKQTDSVSQG